MSNSKSKNSKKRNRSLKRNPMTFSVLQKKKERSEVRKNTAISQESESPKESLDTSGGSENRTDSLSPVLEQQATALSKTNSTSKSESGNNHTYDPSIVFPYSNRPHETRQKTIAEESKQWESLFDPQNTFGSFQQGIAKPISTHKLFYKGKWPLDQRDVIGMAPKNRSHLQGSMASLSITDDANATYLFPSVPSPTLPDKKQLQFHINPALQDDSTNSFENSTSMSQIEILPCPSLSQFPKSQKLENEMLWKDRLELLKTIQDQGFSEDLNGTQQRQHKGSAATRLQRQIKKKAKKIKRETLVDSSTEESDVEEQHDCNMADEDAGDKALLVAVEPDTFDSTIPSNVVDTPDIPADQSSLITLDDEWENISFHHHQKYPAEDCDIEKQQIKQKEIPEVKRKNRPTFLLFAYGFLFPPLWVIGALYTPNSSIQRTTTSKKIDRKWKNYSRNAFFAFIVVVATAIVLVLILKPQAVGFRTSSEDTHQEERVVFDSSDNIAAGQQLTPS